MKKLSEIEITKEIKEKASKCTTAEEPTALAREYDVELTQEEISGIMNNNAPKELRDDDLDQVTGGSWADDKAKYLTPNHGPHIGKYEAEHHLREYVYCVNDDNPKEYFWGQLWGSYESEYTGFWGQTRSRRLHSIFYSGHNRNEFTYVRIKILYGEALIPTYGTYISDILGDKCTLFKVNP